MHDARRAAAWRRRRVAVVRPVRIAFVRVFSPAFRKNVGNRPSARTACLEVVKSPNWRQCFLVKDALTRATSRRFQRGNGASARHRGPPCATEGREHGAVSDETNIKVYSRHPTVPLFCLPRGDAAVAACQARGYLHVAGAYGAQSGRTKKLDAFTGAPQGMPCARTACGFPKNQKIGSLSGVPPSHDFRATILCTSRRHAIAACQGRVRDALDSTTPIVNSSTLV